MADPRELILTLNGIDAAVWMIREFSDRCRLAGSIEYVERRIGRKLADLVPDLFEIRQDGTDLWVEPTPEFARVMSALDG